MTANPRDLGLPPGEAAMVDQAREAVRVELEASARPISLVGHQIDDLGGALVRLRLGGSLARGEWEGGEAHADEVGEWGAQIIAVDEAAGHIYLDAETDGPPPAPGPFTVEPFPFLRPLARLLSGSIPGSGGAMAQALAASIGVSASDSWSYLWGPPGTGKTYRIGRMVAADLRDETERILVVSTTNQATDGVALSIGQALRSAAPGYPLRGHVMRVGRRANYPRFENHGYTELLDDTDTALRIQLADCEQRLIGGGNDPETRARLLHERGRIARAIAATTESFWRSEARCIITTMYSAIAQLGGEQGEAHTAQGTAPFTTVIVDEAGLVGRVAAAALSLLASRRFVLVGDPRQLAPISAMARVLPPSRKRWLASSAMDHLRPSDPGSAVMLTEQHRMAPDIRRVVSEYRYDGALHDAPDVSSGRAAAAVDRLLADQPRAIWYVLDEDAGERGLHNIRAERGPGGRSWWRPHTLVVLDRLFRTHPRLAAGSGLFVTPFRGQAARVRRWLATECPAQAPDWTASTIHAQQGSEAQFVIFDTVRAGATGFGFDDWLRIVNVGISRARSVVIVLASRAEMDEPYLRPLRALLAPRILRGAGGHIRWRSVSVSAGSPEMESMHSWPDPTSLGGQLARRRAMRPIMSREQQRLSRLPMDGRPRLVRGVAGSGKTWVMAHWVAETARRYPEWTIWVVYGNRALLRLIGQNLDEALGADMDARRGIHLHNVRDILRPLLQQHGGTLDHDDFDLDAASGRLATLMPKVPVTCNALFVDEAQDLGPTTLSLLTHMVEPSAQHAHGERQAIFFYDNAQNLYGRGVPNWAAMGLAMRGRSTVMRESFRSTVPITEVALNTFYRLADAAGRPDHAELTDRGLLELTECNGRPWWRAHYVRTEGPLPTLATFQTEAAELADIRARLRRWVVDEHVRPRDIRVLVTSHARGEAIAAACAADLEIEYQTGTELTPQYGGVLVSTPHSFKGYDAEVVLVAGLQGFFRQGCVRAESLYVAMTRARAILHISGVQGRAGVGQRRLFDVVGQTIADSRVAPGPP